MRRLAELTVEEKTDLLDHHLGSCWDALREAEGITGVEIETDDIAILRERLGI